MNFRVGVSLVALAYCALVAAGEPEPEMLGPAEWPTTVEATVKNILASMSEKDKEALRTTKKEDLWRYHRGWGTWIRNYYGLWRGNRKLIESACGAPCHPDNASGIIIQATWEQLQK